MFSTNYLIPVLFDLYDHRIDVCERWRYARASLYLFKSRSDGHLSPRVVTSQWRLVVEFYGRHPTSPRGFVVVELCRTGTTNRLQPHAILQFSTHGHGCIRRWVHVSEHAFAQAAAKVT